MPESRTRVWFAMFVLAVFCVGLAGGVLIGRRLPSERPIDRLLRGPRDFGPPLPGEGRRGGPIRGLLVERLSRELDLTSEQRAKIDAALASARTRLDALQKDVRERFDGERRAVRDEIRAVLTPSQQQTFDRLELDGRGRSGRRGPPR
jgi:Spy/CpxP family protein refolding chaperone